MINSFLGIFLAYFFTFEILKNPLDRAVVPLPDTEINPLALFPCLKAKLVYKMPGNDSEQILTLVPVEPARDGWFEFFAFRKRSKIFIGSKGSQFGSAGDGIYFHKRKYGLEEAVVMHYYGKNNIVNGCLNFTAQLSCLEKIEPPK